MSYYADGIWGRMERCDNIKAQDERPVEYFYNLPSLFGGFSIKSSSLVQMGDDGAWSKSHGENGKVQKNILTVLLLGTRNCRVKERITDASWVCIVRKNYA